MPQHGVNLTDNWKYYYATSHWLSLHLCWRSWQQISYTSWLQGFFLINGRNRLPWEDWSCLRMNYTNSRSNAARLIQMLSAIVSSQHRGCQEVWDLIEAGNTFSTFLSWLDFTLYAWHRDYEYAARADTLGRRNLFLGDEHFSNLSIFQGLVLGQLAASNDCSVLQTPLTLCFTYAAEILKIQNVFGKFPRPWSCVQQWCWTWLQNHLAKY